MKSLDSFIPAKGIAMMFPAKGGRILGPLGFLGITAVAMATAIGMLRGNTELLPPSLNLLLLASLVAVVYSIQCNPKGTKKSPFAL